MSTAAETSATIVSAASLWRRVGFAGIGRSHALLGGGDRGVVGVAGAGFGMTSLALDVASAKLGGGEIEVRAQVDKRTRSIVFASVEAWQGQQLVFSAQGLFSRREPK